MSDLQRTVAQVKSELAFTNKAFAELEAAMMAEMFATNAEQTTKRERLFFAVRALRMAHKALIKAAAEGEALVNYQTLLAESGLTSPHA